jgi:hypothetical protein
MAIDATDVVRTATVRLDDCRELWFQTYSLGRRRLGGVRVYESNKKFWGPTRSGFDMNLDQLQQLIPTLASLATLVEEGSVTPPLEYARIPAGRTSEWVVQVLEPNGISAVLLLDIRKYVSTETFTGFTRKGLRLDFEHIDAIVDHLPSVCESLDAWHKGDWGLFAQEESIEPNEPKVAPESVPDEYRDYF